MATPVKEDGNEERRVTPQCQGAYALAILYTIGYLSMMGVLMFFEVPAANEKLLYTLAGLMSAIQMGITKHYYDGTKSGEAVQAANIARVAKTESALQEIAKTVPVAAAKAAADAPGTIAGIVGAATGNQTPTPTPTPDGQMSTGTVELKADVVNLEQPKT